MASKRKPNGYYQILENTISEAKKVMKKYDFDALPSTNKLRELGYFGLRNAINLHHGGFNNFREKHFGEKLLKKPGGYWESLETCLDTSKSLMKEHGLDTLPSQKKFQELGYGGLSRAIIKHHGGLPNFREKQLGEEL